MSSNVLDATPPITGDKGGSTTGDRSATPAQAIPTRLSRHPRKCTARNRNGEPCGKWAIVGGFVCRNHGGSTPAVVHAARERLAFLADPAIERLFEIINDPLAEDGNVIRACLGILDRTGIGPSSKIEVEPVKREGPDLEQMSARELRAYTNELGEMARQLGEQAAALRDEDEAYVRSINESQETRNE